jgi:FkbM family methyltransferase
MFKWDVLGKRITIRTTLSTVDAVGTIIEGEYDRLLVKGREVVDIGGSIGDTAIYFIARGALHVYAFEPHKDSFVLAEQNISANGMEGQITLVNKAISNQGKGSLAGTRGAIGVEFTDENRSELVETVSLGALVRELNLRNAVLKMDCEGCERNAILGAAVETLRTFTQMQIEFHSYPGDLVVKLRKAGFKAEVRVPKKTRTKGYFPPGVGFIDADRVEF